MALRPGRVVLSALAPEKAKPERSRSGGGGPKAEKPRTPRPEPGSLEESIAMGRAASKGVRELGGLSPAQVAAKHKLYRHPKTVAADAAAAQEARP